MIALRVAVNGQPVCTAGAEDLGVLNAIIGALGTLGSQTRVLRDGEEPSLTLRVGGLTNRISESDEHLSWIESLSLNIGDEVTISLIRTESPDSPTSSRKKDEERAKNKRREEWEYAKEYYETFRAEFEGGSNTTD